MLTNREKRYLIESVLESLNEGAPVEPTEEDAIRWALNNAGRGYDYVKNLSSVHNLLQSENDFNPDASYKPIGLKNKFRSAVGGHRYDRVSNEIDNQLNKTFGDNNGERNRVQNLKFGVTNALRDAKTVGGAGIGALVGGIVGATTKKARIARLRNAIKKCGGNEECIAKLEATLNRLKSGTNWSALIGAAIGGGLGAYGGSKYGDYSAKKSLDAQKAQTIKNTLLSGRDEVSKMYINRMNDDLALSAANDKKPSRNFPQSV